MPTYHEALLTLSARPTTNSTQNNVSLTTRSLLAKLFRSCSAYFYILIQSLRFLFRWVSSRRQVVWDLIVAVLIVYGCISIPLRIGFDLGTGIGQIVVDAVVDVVFVLDMILSFRTAFVAPDGEMVTIPNEIAARYLKGSFMIDLCSTVPIDLLVLSAGGTRGILRSTKLLRTLRLLRLARLMKLSSIGGKEEDVEKLLHPSLWALIKMLVMLLFIAHIMGCMWHWLVVLRFAVIVSERGRQSAIVNATNEDQRVVHDAEDLRRRHSVSRRTLTKCSGGQSLTVSLVISGLNMRLRNVLDHSGSPY